MTKPFSFVVLLARIRALLRRIMAERPAQLQVGDLVLDPATRTAQRAGSPIDLTPREFALLEYLMRNAGAVISKSELLDHVSNVNFNRPLNVVRCTSTTCGGSSTPRSASIPSARSVGSAAASTLC